MSAVAFEVGNATALLLPPSIGLRRPLRVAPPKQYRADLLCCRQLLPCCAPPSRSSLNAQNDSRASSACSSPSPAPCWARSAAQRALCAYPMLPWPPVLALPAGPLAALLRLAGVLDVLLRPCVLAVAAPLNGRAHGPEQRPDLANSSEFDPTGPSVSLGTDQESRRWVLMEPARLPHRFRPVLPHVLCGHFGHKHANQLGVGASQTVTSALEVARSCRRA